MRATRLILIASVAIVAPYMMSAGVAAPTAHLDPALLIGHWTGMDGHGRQVAVAFSPGDRYSFSMVMGAPPGAPPVLSFGGHYVFTALNATDADLLMTPDRVPPKLCLNPADQKTCHGLRVPPDHIPITLTSPTTIRFGNHKGFSVPLHRVDASSSAQDGGR
jgi:hypothetical protein